MAIKTIKDFHIGDQVYHLSNSRIKMVVVEIIEDVNKVVCRWLDNDGKLYEKEFISQEIEEISPTRRSFVVGYRDTKNHY